MSRPRSYSLTRALEMVAAGATVYAAAKACGLQQSSVARAIKPPAKKVCPCCGKTANTKARA